MICSTFIPSCPWYSQGQEFFTDLKVLALGTYDAILGMDWLEEHSPMTVYWRNRFIEISTPAGPLRLEGHDAASAVCESINSVQLQGLCSKGSISHIVHLCVVAPASEPSTPIPECIQRVINEFPDVFAEPTGLPPRRACDHRIPLIPGAQPVNIRPYRHKPEHKTEIEAQVEALLNHSTQYQPLFFTCHSSKEKRWNVAPVHRLQTSQRPHCGGQIPSPCYRRTLG